MHFFINLFNSKVKRWVGAVCLGLFLWGAMLLPCSAATFSHIHTGACYGEVWAPCTALHQSSTRNTSSSAHCPNCKTSTSHTLYVNWDHCFGDGQDYEQGGRSQCSKCGGTSYTWGGSGTGGHETLQNQIICGKNDAPTGALTLKNLTPQWTTQEVTLQADIIKYSGDLQIPPAPFSWDNAGAWTTINTKTASENGTYTVFARDTGGRVISEKIAVNNIDRRGPSLTATTLSQEEWTNEDVLVTLTAVDLQENGGKGVGLLPEPFSYDGGITYVGDNTFVSIQNEIKEIYLQDQLGNIAIAQVHITNIDKLPPDNVEMNCISEGWQNVEVIMEAKAEDQEDGCGLHKEPYSLDGVNWQESPEFCFEENGNYELYVRDAIGNQNILTFQVGSIDKTPPKILTLKANEETMEWDKIEFTIIAEDLQPDGSQGSGLHKEAFSIDGGKTFHSTGTFMIQENQTYDLVVRDTFLQESQVFTVKRGFFPYPKPQEEDTPNPGKKPEPMPLPEEEIETEAPTQTETDKELKNWPYAFGKEGLHEITPVPLENKEKQILNEELKATKEEERIILHRPWYATPEGIAIIACSGIIGSLLLALWILWLCIFGVRVYSIERKQTLKSLGWIILHKEEKGYSVFLPNFMIKSSSTGNYRIQFSKWILGRAENAPLLVECEEKSIEIMIQETLDFAL